MTASYGRITATLLAVVLIGVCALTGCYDLFANFRPYDDEGVLMMSNRLFLDGQVPYTEIQWLYGPVQIALVQLLHGTLQLPITHTAVRFLTLAMWLLLSLFAGLLAGRLTGSTIWSLTAALAVFLFTGSIVNEPGHPQSLIASLVLLVPLLSDLIGDKRQHLTWLLAGVVAALVFHIKLNAGVFLIAGIAVVIAGQFRPPRYRTLIRCGLIAASLLFPFLLMYPLLSVPGCLGFAVLAALSTAATTIAASRVEATHLRPASAAANFTAGFTAATLAALLYATTLDISPLDILANLSGYARKQADFYHFFLPYSPFQLFLAAVSVAVAAGLFRLAAGAVRRRAGLAAKSAFALLAGYALAINDAADAHAMAGYAWPWCWLVMLDRAGNSSSTTRLFLAGIAGWSPLLAYPIPGSQIYFGSVPILLMAVICAADVLDALKLRRGVRTAGREYMPANLIPALLLLLAMVALGGEYFDNGKRYRAQKPLALYGTGLMRLPPNQVKHYRRLVAEVCGSDRVVTTFRFYSLYLWSGGTIPMPTTISHWPLEYDSPAAQRRIADELRQAERPRVIARKSDEKQTSRADISLWIKNNFETYKTIGPYRIKRRRQQTPPG